MEKTKDQIVFNQTSRKNTAIEKNLKNKILMKSCTKESS